MKNFQTRLAPPPVSLYHIEGCLDFTNLIKTGRGGVLSQALGDYLDTSLTRIEEIGLIAPGKNHRYSWSVVSKSSFSSSPLKFFKDICSKTSVSPTYKCSLELGHPAHFDSSGAGSDSGFRFNNLLFFGADGSISYNNTQRLSPKILDSGVTGYDVVSTTSETNSVSIIFNVNPTRVSPWVSGVGFNRYDTHQIHQCGKLSSPTGCFQIFLPTILPYSISGSLDELLRTNQLNSSVVSNSDPKILAIYVNVYVWSSATNYKVLLNQLGLPLT